MYMYKASKTLKNIFIHILIAMVTSLFIFLFYLQIILANDAYTCSKSINTPFKTSKEFIDNISSKNFFDKYLEVVKAEHIEYVPKVNHLLSFPQIINYRAVPDIPMIPSFMLRKINICQQWNRIGDVFVGEVSTKFISFNVNLSTHNCGNDVFMNMEGKLIDKISILPNRALDILLEQFGGIFLHIMGNIGT